MGDLPLWVAYALYTPRPSPMRSSPRNRPDRAIRRVPGARWRPLPLDSSDRVDRPTATITLTLASRDSWPRGLTGHGRVLAGYHLWMSLPDCQRGIAADHDFPSPFPRVILAAAHHGAASTGMVEPRTICTSPSARLIPTSGTPKPC